MRGSDILFIGCSITTLVILGAHGCQSLQEPTLDARCAHMCLDAMGNTDHALALGECFCVLDGKVVTR